MVSEVHQRFIAVDCERYADGELTLRDGLHLRIVEKGP